MSNILEEPLLEALEDEYRARATYTRVIETFGPVRPFANIVRAEDRHVHALLPLFRKYQIAVPADRWFGRVTIPETLRGACEQAVQAEIENVAMYRRLLASTAAFPDVQQVLRNLQRASQQNHLPAFQRAAARYGSTVAFPRTQSDAPQGTRLPNPHQHDLQVGCCGAGPRPHRHRFGGGHQHRGRSRGGIG